MVTAILIGILLGADRAPSYVAIAIIVGFVTMGALIDILFPRRPLVGTESPYLLYQKNFRDSGEHSPRPWIGYFAQCYIFYIPFGLVAYFVARYFAS
jgi:hypothetical protein